VIIRKLKAGWLVFMGIGALMKHENAFAQISAAYMRIATNIATYSAGMPVILLTRASLISIGSK